jgi:hypothetical protein
VTLPLANPSPRGAIRLMPEADVPAAIAGGEFRYSRLTAAAVAGVMVIASVMLILIGLAQGNPFTYYIAALILVFLWIYQAMVLARFRGSNWLVRLDERGMYLKFRSYLNHHFPATDPVVAYIPFRDLRLTKVVREVQEVPDTDGRGTSTRQRTVIEIELQDDAPELAGALEAERRAEAPRLARWYGSTAGKYRHYPVRMAAPRIIAIEWGVRPSAARFVQIMAVHAPVEAAVAVRDYTALGALKRHEQESKLLELVESGRIMDAIRLARSLYGYDVTEAKQFVDGLSTRAKA